MEGSEIRKIKLERLEKLRPLFSLLPFVNFVLIAGSLAFGKPKETSDFDVILGCEKGRIWTARAFAIFIFGFHKVRRTSKQKGMEASDKVCLNHFITKNSYRLQEPHNEYWQKLYQNLIPFVGDKAEIEKFFIANKGWSMKEQTDFYVKSIISARKNFLEFVLAGLLGDWLEKFLRFIQIKKINLNPPDPTRKPRIIVSNDELEFHPDTLRIEEYLKNK
jgi:hypothetical protein